jgi:beta-glucuronidase
MRRRDLLTGVGTGAGAALFLGSQTAGLQKQGQRLILDLSGPWRLSMDDRNTGLSKRWFEREPAASEARRFEITVPSVWQQYLELQGGVGWYYKDLHNPKELSGRFLRIRFEAVDYRARVWLNGQEAGTHDGGFTPFEVDVSHFTKAGTNRLAVRVSDVGRDFRAGYCGLPGWGRIASCWPTDLQSVS